MQSLRHVAKSQHAVTGWEDFGCAMQDLVLSVISLIIFNYHSTIISWFLMFRCLLHLTIVEFLHRGMQAHLTWGSGLVALVSQLQFTPCKCQHQAATAWNVNFRARGNFKVLWAEMTTRWHCLLAMLAMHWWLLTWTSKHFSSVFSNICPQFLKPLHSRRLLLDQPAENLPSSATSTFVPATAPSRFPKQINAAFQPRK